MDDDYFVYYEDIDLSRRLCDAGYKSYFIADCSIFHKGGASGEAVSAKRLFYSLSARNIYWFKHLDQWHAIILTILSFSIEPILRTVLILSKAHFSEIPNVIIAHFLYFKKVVFKKD
jgi:GT2 family glycosyltransferase